MRISRFCLLLVLLLCLGLPVASSAEEPEEEVIARTPSGYLNRSLVITDRVQAERDYLVWDDMPLRPTNGVLGLSFTYNHRRIDSRYDDSRDLYDNVNKITYQNDAYGQGEFLKLKNLYKGRFQLLTFGANFGITDNVGGFLSFPFRMEETWLDVEFTPGTSAALGIRTREDFFELLERMGRPRPRHAYQSKTLEPGDLETGLFWNYFDIGTICLTALGRVSFPTGRLANPNEALIYGLGPQTDVGHGSYGVGFSQRINLIPLDRIKWIGLTFEGTYRYFADGKRKAPMWLDPDPQFAQDVQNLGDVGAYFIDPRNTEGNYSVTYGSQVDALAGVTFTFHYFAVGLGYRFAWEQEPEVTADKPMEKLLDELKSFPGSERHSAQLQVAVPLNWAYFPGVVNMGYRHDITGRNAFKWEDNLTAQINLLLPF